MEREDGYHHGALRDALVAATDAILLERGAEGFTLREAARRAGVSPAAPSHHFGSAAGLLTEVAVRAFDQLTEALRSAVGDRPPAERLREQMAAYVKFAMKHPGRFRLMFSKDRLDRNESRLDQAASRAYGELEETVGLYTGRQATLADIAVVAAGCWSLAHGFAHLALDGKFKVMGNESDDLLDRLLPAVLARFID